MAMPMTSTSTPDKIRMGLAKRLFNLPLTRPKPSIRGMVPRQKQAMESAPMYQLPVDRA